MASGGGYAVTLSVLRVFHCEKCRIRIRDHCLRSLDRYQGATALLFLKQQSFALFLKREEEIYVIF